MSYPPGLCPVAAFSEASLLISSQHYPVAVLNLVLSCLSACLIFVVTFLLLFCFSHFSTPLHTISYNLQPLETTILSSASKFNLFSSTPK